MQRIYRESDATLAIIRNKKVAVIGYGNQAAAQACNLRTSEVPLVVGLRTDSPRWEKALADGHRVMSIAEAGAWGEVVMLLIADEAMPEVYARDIFPQLSSATVLGVSHGFALHYKLLTPRAPAKVFMVAPKGPGYQVREAYVRGEGIPGLIASAEEDSGELFALALSYAKAIGCLRVGGLRTTFREETESDLFGEQAVLCGGVPALLKAAFTTLVEAGYSPELAYIECVYELKLIVDLLAKGGLSFLREAISNTAEYGSYAAGDLLVDGAMQEKMRGILARIQDGSFAEAWMQEHRGGKVEMLRRRNEEKNILLERVGAELRNELLQ
jgi:ketol-acid reductoisomerase